MISFIYNLIFVPIALLIIRILKIFNPKLKERENECKNSLSILEDYRKTNYSKVIWVHSASMGEFEQAKPIIEFFKNEYQNICIIVSFFSPSGYNNQKKYSYADFVIYLPFDTKKNAKELLEIINPDIAIFIRYEIWHNYLRELKNRDIPAFLICATAPRSLILKKFPYFKQFTENNYAMFNSIFTVGEEHSLYFRAINIDTEIITLSDTRFDRIIDQVESTINHPLLDKSIFNENSFVLVAGSTWEKDEDILLNAFNFLKDKSEKILYLILVPHEPTDKHLLTLHNKINDYVFLSELLYNQPAKLNKQIIVVDSIGKLLKLYANADAAYIGGAFGAGVHSVTEPAGYGIPLACGNLKYQSSPDAVNLSKINALTIISNEDDMIVWLENLITNPDYANSLGELSHQYIYNAKGSSKIIEDKLVTCLF